MATSNPEACTMLLTVDKKFKAACPCKMDTLNTDNVTLVCDEGNKLAVFQSYCEDAVLGPAPSSQCAKGCGKYVQYCCCKDLYPDMELLYETPQLQAQDLYPGMEPLYETPLQAQQVVGVTTAQEQDVIVRVKLPLP